MTGSDVRGLRVLYILRYFPTLTETFVYREIRGLRDRGVAVDVAAIGQRADGELQNPVPVGRVRRPPVHLHWIFAGLALLPTLLTPKGWAGFRWIRRRVGWRRGLRFLALSTWARDYDRVHVHFAGEAAEVAHLAHRIWGVAYTVTTHAVDLFKPRESLEEVLTRAERVIAISEHNQQWLAERHGIHADLVRCGVELEPPASSDEPRPEVQAAAPLQVLSVGRWVPKKGLDLLVEAVEALDGSAHLSLISDAPADVASAHVHLLGLLPPDALRAHFKTADVVALPCRKAPDGDMDGVPVVLMEALAFECPVITCPVSGVPELVDDAVGWLIPSDDVTALQEALRAASDPEERRRRGVAGPNRLLERGFTLDAQVEGLLRTWKS